MKRRQPPLYPPHVSLCWTDPARYAWLIERMRTLWPPTSIAELRRPSRAYYIRCALWWWFQSKIEAGCACRACQETAARSRSYVANMREAAAALRRDRC